MVLCQRPWCPVPSRLRQMQNATDAAMLTSSPFQQSSALALAVAITNFVK